MKKLIFLISVVFTILSCKNSNKNDKVLTLSFDWYTNMSFTGEVEAATKFAKENGIEIKLRSGSENLDPIKLVISGSSDVGIISADKFLLAVDKGADIVAIGVINLNSPTVFLSLAEDSIKTPKDFEGKIVGMLPGGSTEFVYLSLLKEAKVDRRKIKEQTVSFDLSTFISKMYNIRPSFIYDEPVTLDSKNIKYNMIQPKDYNVVYLGRVYFTTTKKIKESPQLIQSFINSVARGWEYTLENPTLAIQDLYKYDNTLDTIRETKSLLKGLNYFRGEGKILFAENSRWTSTMNTLIDLNLIKNKKEVSNLVNNSFLNNYYSSKH